MKQALRRGIRMKIMVSANSDNKLVPEVVGIQMKKMMRRGAEVYYFEGGFHHSKIMTVDNEIGIIGTANLDGRSLRYDYEVNAVVFDPQVTKELNEIFRRSALQSQILTPKNFKQRFSLKRRFVGRMFQPIKGLL
jgi:cardiolipin synthase